MNIALFLEMAADVFGSRTAFVDASNGESISYRGLFQAARAKAQVMRESGVAHCALIDTANLTIPVALFASGWAGLPYVPINYRLTATEIDALLARVEPALLVTDAERKQAITGRQKLVVHDRQSFREVHPVSDDVEPWTDAPDAIAVLLFTSGTTGVPKAAIMRHKHLVSYTLMTEFASAEEDEAALVSVPPYHIAGIAAILTSVYACRRVVQLPTFEPNEWLRVAREQNVTSTFVVPTMLARIVEALDGQKSANLPHLHALSYGGGKMPLNVIRRAMDLFPDTEFTNAYGLTETSSTISLLGPDDHRAAHQSDDPNAQKRLASAGTALPGIEIAIKDDVGRELGPNERGEIYVRGEQVSGEYEGIGSRIDAEGWFPTRDAGYVDADGYLFLDGRADDVIVRGGENLSPGEIEDVLREHEVVRDAAVVGVPSEEWGEAVVAAVEVSQEIAVEALQDWVRDHMRSSRVPEQIHFWDELPYNETGKLLRRVVKESFTGKDAT
ncbi:MAG: acyl--CoA ligase [Gammaproteobacteria bacterium]|nr:acyl--CoA ligase [Gammaproteobacteria bacterium]